MRAMTSAKTAGQKLVAMLDGQLPSGVEWTPKELAVCGLIADTADDVETLKKLLAAELAKVDCSTHRCAELAGEIRQARAAIAKMVASLDPEMQMQAKSVRHQSAAHSRWSGAGLGG